MKCRFTITISVDTKDQNTLHHEAWPRVEELCQDLKKEKHINPKWGDVEIVMTQMRSPAARTRDH